VGRSWEVVIIWTDFTFPGFYPGIFYVFRIWTSTWFSGWIFYGSSGLGFRCFSFGLGLGVFFGLDCGVFRSLDLFGFSEDVGRLGF
jgi:hypothetical protein